MWRINRSPIDELKVMLGMLSSYVDILYQRYSHIEISLFHILSLNNNVLHILRWEKVIFQRVKKYLQKWVVRIVVGAKAGN